MAAMDFASIILDLADGEVNTELTRRLQKAIEKVKEHKKKASLTITLAITEKGGFATIDVDCKAKLPEPDMAGTAFYFGDEAGTIQHTNPKQMRLTGLAAPTKLQTAPLPMGDPLPTEPDDDGS